VAIGVAQTYNVGAKLGEVDAAPHPVLRTTFSA
jgi:hypothetical protein